MTPNKSLQAKPVGAVVCSSRLRFGGWLTFLVVALSIGATSCRPHGESNEFPEQNNSSFRSNSDATENSHTNAASEPHAVVSDDAILGPLPKPAATRAEVEQATFSFKVGDTYHDAKELAALALQYVEKTDKNIVTNRIRIHVILLVDNKDLLAEVLIGSGIGKPCWGVTITKRLTVHSCKRGIGQG